MRNVWIALVIAGLLALGWGIHLRQPADVYAWGTTLCTSCIGLTEPEGGN